MTDITVTLSTCCRNRAGHVKNTMIQNLIDNPEPYVRFLLVNYNSQDDLNEWARITLGKFIPSGRLLYVHEKTAKRFMHAHARNVAVRACQTDVICNVDADNYTGPGFARWLHDTYLEHWGEPVFTAYGGDHGAPCGDLFGRISFVRKHQIAVGGYNEDLNTWGVEDFDMVKRAEQGGLKRLDYISQFDKMEPIKHAHDVRIEGTEFETPLAAMVESERLLLGKYGREQNPNAKGQWGKATVEVNWKRTVELPLSAGETLP